jgi:hypothetical protein
VFYKLRFDKLRMYVYIQRELLCKWRERGEPHYRGQRNRVGLLDRERA